MASVAYDRDLDLGVVWHLLLLAMFVAGHSDLETSGHGLELVGSSHITVLQAGAHWVDIEEGVLSVLNVGHRLPVERLVTLVANSW